MVLWNNVLRRNLCRNRLLRKKNVLPHSPPPRIFHVFLMRRYRAFVPHEIRLCVQSMYRQKNVEEYGEFLTGLPSPSLHFPSLAEPSSDDQRR